MMRQKTTLELGLRFKHVDYTKFDFKYLRDGPWPQLMPDRPMGDLPEVVKVPQAEWKQYHRYVTPVYRNRLIKTAITGAWFALTHDRYQDFDDARFTTQLTEGVYSKFLTAWPEPAADDLGIGKDLAELVDALDDRHNIFFSDFELMRVIRDDLLPDNYIAVTTVVFQRVEKYHFKPLAIRISGMVLTPADGEAWELAKYFALQAAEYCIKFINHIRLHFPFDTVNALTKSTLPTEHIIYQLLFPHLFLSLPVNNSVLESPRSVASDDPDKNPIYSPFACKSAYVRKMLHLGVDGIDGHSAYPAYDFFDDRPLNTAPGAKPTPSKFGDVMARYWVPYRKFVAAVVDHYAERVDKLQDAEAAGTATDSERKQLDLEKLAIWALEISQFLPGFPSDTQIIAQEPDGRFRVNRDKLTETLTTIVWTVSIAHAMDHVDDTRIKTDEKPYRIRIPPPQSSNISPFSRKAMVRHWDFFQSRLVHEAFTKPITTRSMLQVHYDFKENSGLPALAQTFIQDLIDLEAQIRKEGTLDRDPAQHHDPDGDRQFILLKDAACSVQY